MDKGLDCFVFIYLERKHHFNGGKMSGPGESVRRGIALTPTNGLFRFSSIILDLKGVL